MIYAIINAIIILIVLDLNILAAFLLFFYRRKMITAIYDFVRHREIKFFLLSLAKFCINVGVSAASLVLIAYYIPQIGVTTVMLIKVGISGIILSIGAYYMERFLK